jgi:gas vesicle protein
MKRMMNFLVGAALGGLVGATLAILLAPYSGDELRNQMQTRVDQVRQDMEKAANTRRAELETQLQSLRSPAPPVE